MPTQFIIGLKGGGKGLLAQKRIIQELRTTKRSIVTNQPVEYERLREFLIEKYGSDFDMKKRLLILETHQCSHFWDFYGVRGVTYIPPEQLEPKAREQHPEGRYVFEPAEIKDRIKLFEAEDAKHKVVTAPDFSDRANWPSVLYVIDEVHVFFNARRWSRTGDDCLYYMSQERHFGDDQLLITQNFENVDKAMRFMACDYIYCSNHRKTRIPLLSGIFRGPPIFSRHHYPEPVGRGMTQQVPTVSRTFTLDKDGVASTYRTAAGVGHDMFGEEADKNDKVTGISLWWLIPVAAMLVIGIFYGSSKLPLLFTGRAAKVAAKGVPVDTNSVSSNPNPLTNSYARVTQAVSTMKAQAQSALTEAAKQVEEQAELFLSGTYFVPRQGLMVMLSDGRNFKVGDGVCEYVIKSPLGTITGAKVEGKILRFKQESPFAERKKF